MAQDLVVWTGPVGEAAVPKATIPGAKRIFIGCLGDREPLCPTIGDQLSSDPELLLSKAGMSRSDLGELYLGAFSAGGSLLKRLLKNPEYRAVTASMVLADATYTSTWDDRSTRTPPVMYGFIDYAMDVLSSGGRKLFVSTASTNYNKEWASGVENIQRLRQEIERLSGRSFERLDHMFGVTNPNGVVAEAVYKLDNIILAEFTGSSHFGHSHYQLQEQIWRLIVNPWVAQGKGVISSSPELAVSKLSGWLPFVIGLAAGAAITVFALRGRNGR